MDQQAFLTRLVATFRIEAQEHLQRISSELLAVETAATPEERAEHLTNAFRGAHSLKGAARAVNFIEIESICQSMEEALSHWKNADTAPEPKAVDKLLAAADEIEKILRAKPSATSGTPNSEVLHVAEEPGRITSNDERDPAPPVSPIQAATETPSPVLSETRIQTQSPETIRVSAARLDRLLLESEELLAIKQSAAQRAVELRAIEELFDDWNKQWLRHQSARWLKQIPSKENASSTDAEPEFIGWNFAFVKGLENRLRALSKSAVEDGNTTARLIDDILEDSKKLLMQPFAAVADLFPKIVRDLSREQGKEADVVIRGLDMELDRRVLQEIKDPLIHILRNCIDHGVELPDLRLRLKKPRRATITISATAINGNKVEIEVADDGAGIDAGKVREAAVARGALSRSEAQHLTNEQAADLIFRPEITTSPAVTEISGRGIGLAIVREKTEKLGGSVSVESQRNVGAKFRIALPLTLATIRGIVARVGEQVFIIPTLYVERVLRVQSTEVRTVENRRTIPFEGQTLGLVRLADALEIEPESAQKHMDEFVSVVVIDVGREQIGFEVDEILREEEILVKGLCKPLSRVRNVAAATVFPSGKVVVILNASDLIKSARTVKVTPGQRKMTKSKAKKVLVAEDSITSRMLIKGILEAAGYHVTTAVDGVDALTTLRTGDFDIVVSDVEMPRMNGLDLTSQIRSDKRLAEKPVVLVTALASKQDRERGIEVGANAYIVKSSFDQSDLLNVLARLA